MSKNKKEVNQSDVIMEYVKGIFYLMAGYLYFHFVIMGWV
tara:strand:+ start:703 stop:822 length:120 start_codon:yes stop_codon:yes gene_type:complete